ncbi:hypothetical protein NE237_026621 [Protea cynaroides]|uniref:Uncharacterized protein n=1 Tax=Protea cynaroides TaxID=273540 RepID=A0A9Q0K2G9_9MAGN|nr:hypothetical protein NE237_026621 [Protea cynaroides]
MAKEHCSSKDQDLDASSEDFQSRLEDLVTMLQIDELFFGEKLVPLQLLTICTSITSKIATTSTLNEILSPDRAKSPRNQRLSIIATTFNITNVRGSIARILPVLRHSSSPENIIFHFFASHRCFDLGTYILRYADDKTYIDEFIVYTSVQRAEIFTLVRLHGRPPPVVSCHHLSSSFSGMDVICDDIVKKPCTLEILIKFRMLNNQEREITRFNNYATSAQESPSHVIVTTGLSNIGENNSRQLNPTVEKEFREDFRW